MKDQQFSPITGVHLEFHSGSSFASSLLLVGFELDAFLFDKFGADGQRWSSVTGQMVTQCHFVFPYADHTEAYGFLVVDVLDRISGKCDMMFTFPP